MLIDNVVNISTNWTHASYLTARQVLETFSWKEFWESTNFTRLSQQPFYERYRWVTKFIDNAQGYILPKLEKLNQQGTIKRRQGSARSHALNLNDEKWVCPKSPQSPSKSTLQIIREVQTSRALMCPNLQCTGHREKRNKKSRSSLWNCWWIQYMDDSSVASMHMKKLLNDFPQYQNSSLS